MKQCTNCSELKPITEFYKQSKAKDGLTSACKTCCKAKNLSNYVKNKDKVLSQVAAYRKANPEKVKATKRADYDRNKQIYADRTRLRHEANPEIRKAKNKARYDSSPEKMRAQKKAYYAKNREKLRAATIQYQRDNKERYNAYQSAYRRRKAEESPVYALEVLCRSRVLSALRVGGFKKGTKTAVMVGCTYAELKSHLEAKFSPGMTWENRGKKGWHIDHIVPLSSAKTEEELAALCHYSNMQPLWASDNYRKGAKIPATSQNVSASQAQISDG